MQGTQWLIFIGAISLVVAGLLKFSKTRPARPEKIEKPINSNVATVMRPEPKKIENATEERIDFGVAQGFKFAFGFWIGTIVLAWICAAFFGSVIFAAINSAVQHSAQSSFSR